MSFITAALTVVATATLYGSVLAVLVLLLLRLTEHRLPARWRFALWFLVLIRLSMLPMPESRLSALNLLPGRGLSTARQAQNAEVSRSGGQAIPGGAIVVGSVQSAPPAAAAGKEAPSAASAVQVPALPARIAASPLSIGRFALSILGVLYVVGLGAVLLRLAFATLALRRIVRAAEPVRDPVLLASLDAARAALHIRPRLPLRLTDQLASPALVGLFKPRLLLPRHLLAACSTEDLHFIFLHECAHLRRRDILLNYWLALVSAVHWFNPLVWLLLPRIKADRELAADELVLLRTQRPAAYGRTLLKVLEHSTGPLSPRSPGLLASAAVSILESNSKSFFKRRIQMIARYRRTPAWIALPASVALLLLVAVTLTTAITQAADPAGPKSAPVPPEAVRAVASIDFAPDALLRREIAKLGDFKKTITGETDDDKLMRDELDHEIKSIEQFVGVPYPPDPKNSPHSTPRYRGAGGGRPVRFPGGSPGGGPAPAETPAEHAEQLLSDLWRKENADADFHVDKQPLASVIQGIQERLYKSFWMDYAYDGDPRPDIVNAYRMNRITLDWDALGSAGIRPDMLVSVDSKLYGVAILQDLLSSLKAAGAVIQVVNNSGEYGIRLDIQTRVTYNVRDLLAPTNSTQAGGRPISGNPDDLIKGLRLTCSPAWWKNVAGEESILQFKGLMTITTTPEIHEQIRAYLDTLRKADREDAEAGKAGASAADAGPATLVRAAQVTAAFLRRPVHFDLGDSHFPSGDQITITEIRGTSDDFALNNTYQIKGTYTLASHDHARLAVYVTSADAHDAHHDPYDDRQTVLIDKGTGTFTLVLPLLSKGYPHVSFYPVEGGQSFSAAYFGGGDALLKAKTAKP